MKIKNNKLKTGPVYWITGLAGSGKSSIARIFFEKLKSENVKVIYLDGDKIREIFATDSISVESRKKQAKRYRELCKLFSDQGLTVVAAFVALFHKTHQWNRFHIEKYFEIFINVPLKILYKRDKKKLYSGIKREKLSGVVGVDQKAEYPENPDLTINNFGDQRVEDSVDILYNFYLNNK